MKTAPGNCNRRLTKICPRCRRRHFYAVFFRHQQNDVATWRQEFAGIQDRADFLSAPAKWCPKTVSDSFLHDFSHHCLARAAGREHLSRYPSMAVWLAHGAPVDRAHPPPAELVPRLSTTSAVHSLDVKMQRWCIAASRTSARFTLHHAPQADSATPLEPEFRCTILMQTPFWRALIWAACQSRCLHLTHIVRILNEKLTWHA
jgi:hypothetical protein